VTVLGYAAMVCVLIIVGVPLFWIFITSFKARPDIYTQPAVYWPHSWHPANYEDATTTLPFWTFLRNSLIITGIIALVKFVLGVFSAYGLVFLRFPGKTLVFLVIIAALMVPNQITVISNYALIAQLGWRNTFQGIIIPLCGVAFGTFLMRNHFLSLPSEVIEAARDAITGEGWQVAGQLAGRPCGTRDLPEDLVEFYDGAEDDGSCLVFLRDEGAPPE